MAPMLFGRSILEDKPIRIFNEGRLSRDFTYIDEYYRRDRHDTRPPGLSAGRCPWEYRPSSITSVTVLRFSSWILSDSWNNIWVNRPERIRRHATRRCVSDLGRHHQTPTDYNYRATTSLGKESNSLPICSKK